MRPPETNLFDGLSERRRLLDDVTEDVRGETGEALEAGRLRQLEDDARAAQLGEHAGQVVVTCQAQHHAQAGVQAVGRHRLADQTH